MVNKNKVKELKGKLKAELSVGSPNENYGFGSNWSLNIKQGDKPVKSLWLGQGAKVTGRLLGMDYSDYIKDTIKRAGVKKEQWQNEKEWAGNKKINKIVSEDIVHSAFGDEWVNAETDIGGLVNDTPSTKKKRLKKLINANDLDLAVQ